MTILLLSVALMFAVGSYGLMHRTTWAWYLGLAYLHLMTGWYVYTLLFFAWEAGTQPVTLYTGAQIIGVLSFWLCGLLWWLKRKAEFRG